ncbi:hypothetical protein [Ferdinandcohnia sp. Marseille-Q9671]
MVGLWLTLIGMSVLFFISAGFFIYFISSSMDTDDSKRIDPIPKTKK